MVWLSLDRGLLFPAASGLSRALAHEKGGDRDKKDEKSRLVVLDCSSVATLDYTAAKAIKVGRTFEN